MSPKLPRILTRSALVAALAATAFTLGSPMDAADAATYEVTDASDNVAVPNTLRWAIAQASADAAPPVIEIAPGLDIDLTCAGGGVLAYDNAADHQLIVHANGATIAQTCAGHAVLSTAVNEDLMVYDATVTGGQLGGIVGGRDVYVEGSTVEGNTGGPGINGYSGRASIYRSTLRANSGGAGGGVGAIHVAVLDSTLEGNDAANGGGIWADQSAEVTNSTLTGNAATATGGGVYAGLDDVLLHHATVVGNTATSGANVALDTANQLTGFASLVGEPSGGGQDCELNGSSVVSHDFNVTSDSSCGLDTGAADLTDTDPMVAALADNGGPTATRMPAADSPAVDRADCQPLVVDADQRGVSRPQGAACDSGAVEVESDEDPTTPDASSGDASPAVPVALEPRFTG